MSHEKEHISETVKTTPRSIEALKRSDFRTNSFEEDGNDVSQDMSSKNTIDICLNLITRSQNRSFKSIYATYRRQRYQE